MGAGGPALDRRGARGRHQRQQLALVRRAGGGGWAGAAAAAAAAAVAAAALGWEAAALSSPAGPHRTERDATSWSRSKLREVLVGLVVEGEAGRCEICELKQVEGEASCSSRKGRLIFFYEWNLRLSWKGTAGSGCGVSPCPVRLSRRALSVSLRGLCGLSSTGTKFSKLRPIFFLF